VTVRRLPLPAALAAAGYALREERETDLPFLEGLYVSIRWSELEPSGWPDAVKTAFLQSQFALQRRHYRSFYADAECSILEHNGTAAGRIYVYRGAEDHRVVDISIVEAFRNRGLGSALLGAVIEEAESFGKTASVHVERFNVAQRLYRRLGFQQVGESGPYLLMVRRCGRAAAAGGT
jgi:ribosomal protein S18 acetylase RimI-like enzyme